jgi:hypothetical protein
MAEFWSLPSGRSDGLRFLCGGALLEMFWSVESMQYCEGSGLDFLLSVRFSLDD